MSIEIGQKLIERFEVKSLIGRGGMGSIYQCYDNKLSKNVALKVLHKEQVFDARRVQRFQREFALLSSLNSPNIIEVYEEFLIDGQIPCFSLELVEGKPLSAEIKGLLDISSLRERNKLMLTILLDTAKALSCVHLSGIIHHDLNPNNIIVQKILAPDSSQSYKVKLLDFGIALLKDDHSGDEAGAGTLHYKAPEQSKKRKLDFTSDVYAFGTLAYEVLSGKKPFDIEGDVSGMKLAAGVSMMHALRNVAEIKNLHSNISDSINRMVQICMEKASKHRYQSMDEIIERIEDSLLDLEKKTLGEKFLRLFLR